MQNNKTSKTVVFETHCIHYLLLNEVSEVKVEVKMEVKEAPRLQSRLGAKASEKLKWTMVNAFTASFTIVQHAELYFQPAMLA